MKIYNDYLVEICTSFALLFLRHLYRKLIKGKNMEKEIEISKEAKVDIAVKEGFLILSVDYTGKDGGGALSVKVSTDNLLDELAKAIPGTVDDVVIGVIKQALKLV